jgi:hypothetical protein
MLRLLLASLLSLATFAAPAEALAQEWTQGEAPPEPAELPREPDDFITVEGTFLRVHGPESQADLLLRLARHGSAALPRLATRLEVPIGTTVHVYVARDDAEFRALQPGAVPVWADATTWSHTGAVFLRAPSARGGVARPLEQVFDHELVHVLVGRAFGDERPPTWLQEGIARLLADEVLPDEAAALVQARGTGSWLPLSALAGGFPVDALRARLAYAEAGDFVAYLEETYGPAVIPELLRRSAAGEGMNEAVYHSTGDLLHEVEADWTATHAAPWGASLASVLSGEWLWSVGAVALVGAGIQRRRRFHARLEEMGREEAELDALIARLRSGREPSGAGRPAQG